MDKLTGLTTIIGSIIAVGTLANAVWQYRRKVHLEIFRTYADKYNAILPPEIYEKWVRALKGDRELWAELNPTLIRYLNLIWEESYLAQDGAIPRRLWRIWLPEITEVLSSDFVKNAARMYHFHFPVELTVSGAKSVTLRTVRTGN
jgi:hypothetical protein